MDSMKFSIECPRSDRFCWLVRRVGRDAGPVGSTPELNCVRKRLHLIRIRLPISRQSTWFRLQQQSFRNGIDSRYCAICSGPTDSIFVSGTGGAHRSLGCILSDSTPDRPLRSYNAVSKSSHCAFLFSPSVFWDSYSYLSVWLLLPILHSKCLTTRNPMNAYPRMMSSSSDPS
jgi:hypothetical protein